MDLCRGALEWWPGQMVQQVKLALVWEREPAILEREKWNERAKTS